MSVSIFLFKFSESYKICHAGYGKGLDINLKNKKKILIVALTIAGAIAASIFLVYSGLLYADVEEPGFGEIFYTFAVIIAVIYMTVGRRFLFGNAKAVQNGTEKSVAGEGSADGEERVDVGKIEEAPDEGRPVSGGADDEEYDKYQ